MYILKLSGVGVKGEQGRRGGCGGVDESFNLKKKRSLSKGNYFD